MPTDRRSLDIGVVAGCKSIPGPNWNYDRSVVELESIKIDIKLSGRSVDRKSEWEDRLRRDLRSLRGSSSLSKWNGIFGHCKGTDWLEASEYTIWPIHNNNNTKVELLVHMGPFTYFFNNDDVAEDEAEQLLMGVSFCGGGDDVVCCVNNDPEEEFGPWWCWWLSITLQIDY